MTRTYRQLLFPPAIRHQLERQVKVVGGQVALQVECVELSHDVECSTCFGVKWRCRVPSDGE